MRVGLVLIVVGFFWVIACTSTNITDADCIAAGGVCFTEADFGGCEHPLPDYPCFQGGTTATKYYCCTMAYAANYSNGVISDAATGAPDVVGDTGFDVQTTSHDAATDVAEKDAATHVDATTTDAKRD